jgi:hypothetical protein
MFDHYASRGGAGENHQIQLFHYLKSTGLEEGHIVYICRDDYRLAEYGVFNPSPLEARYKKRIDGIKKNNPKNKFPCTLENFIKRYGMEIGSKKYKERCERISYTSSKEFFIDKYGEEEGNKAWKNKFKLVKVSKKSKIISDILTKLKYSFETEKEISGKFLDFYLSDINVGIEYFGDYWHLNPKRYESSFYNSQLKMKAFDVWEKDRCRLNVIKESVDSIIVIWESSEVNETLLEKTIKELKNKKTIIYL